MANQTVEVELVRAFWTGEDERRNEGDVVSLDVDTAMQLIEKGIAKTVLRKAPPLPKTKAEKGD